MASDVRKRLCAPNGIRTKPVQTLVHLVAALQPLVTRVGAFQECPHGKPIVWALNRDAWR